MWALSPAAASGLTLGREKVERFERDGLIVIDDPCPPGLIDAVLRDAAAILGDESHPWKERFEGGVVFTGHGFKELGFHWSRIANAWVFSEPIRKLALDPGVITVIEHLYRAQAVPYQTLNFPVGTEQGVHFDSMHFESDPPGRMCGVWVALEDMDMDNGPLVYYPGSHKLASPSAGLVEKLVGQSLDRRAEFSSHQEYAGWRGTLFAEACRRLIEQHGLEPRYATVRKGQAVVWAANLLHGGSPVRDRSRTRHSQVTHYFFEGFNRVYTPTRTEGDHVFWDYPSWIRDPLPPYSTELVHDTIREHVEPGARVLISISEEEDLLEAEGFQAIRFPGAHIEWRDDPSGSERVEELERLRAEGAQYIVFPRRELPALQNGFPDLQEHLESRCCGLLRDGYTCAIYALE
jgi:ectoine hydroxylase-related dioxygenase (phytanoyl-CoA dioxygenase family)